MMEYIHFTNQELRETEFLQIADNSVHLWLADLDKDMDGDCRCRDTVSDRDYQESQKYTSQARRRYFLKCRALTRRILACYCCIKPKELLFGRTEWGKPYLVASAGIPGSPELSFNTSHCGSLFVLGICRHMEIGVDIELVSPVENIEAIVHRWLAFFPKQEGESTEDAFFRRWTCHEALIKARSSSILCDEQGNTSKTEVLSSYRPASGYWAAVCTVKGNNL